MRAALAIWHLDDPEQQQPALWRARAEHYLALGVEQVEAALRTSDTADQQLISPTSSSSDARRTAENEHEERC